MHSNTTIAVIGAGHLGSAIIAGLIASGHKATHIWATCPRLSVLEELKTRFDIHISTDNVQAAHHCDIVILATKPHHIEAVLTELAPLLQQRKPLLISVAAGVQEATMRQLVATDCAIVRAMPNTPAEVQSSATALFANSFVTAKQKQLAADIFKALGDIVWLEDEQHIFTVTALSGSGPAYFFLLMEALQEAAVKLGLPPDIAKNLTIQTAVGSAQMAKASEQTLSTLRQRVTSPGGGTERALQVLLESNNFHELVFRAIKAAQQRYQELT